MSYAIRSERLPGFVWLDAVKFAPAVGGEAAFILGLPSTLRKGFEIDDPLQHGKRQRHFSFLIHTGKVWRVVWIDRTGSYAARKKIGYGLAEMIGAPVCEFITTRKKP